MRKQRGAPTPTHLRRLRIASVMAAAGALATPPAALAHGGEALTRDTLASSWSAPPLLLAGLLTLTLWVGHAAASAWRRAGVGRSVRVRNVVAYGGAMSALVLSLFSPLASLSDALFSAHMVQHMLLTFVAAPLLVASNLPLVALWGLPGRARRGLARWWVGHGALRMAWHTLSRPAVTWVLFAAMLWLWHLPRFYEAALRSELLHGVEHLLFLGTALLFWWAFARLTEGRSDRMLLGVAYAFIALLQMGALGALLTFASHPLYAAYANSTRAWGLSPLEDQQLGGVIMWVPGHLVFMSIMIFAFYRGLAQESDPAPAQSLSSNEPRAEVT